MAKDTFSEIRVQTSTFSFDPKKSAVLVVDIINDFFEEGGSMVLPGGKVLYDTNWRGKGSIIAADGMLICYTEKGGEVALVKATPEGFDPISHFEIEEGSAQHWAHPALSDGVLYIRHGGALMAYQVK